MNRRKISAMVAAALITSQVQNIAFAETINNSSDTIITSEVISETTNEEINTESKEDNIEITEENIEENTQVGIEENEVIENNLSINNEFSEEIVENEIKDEVVENLNEIEGKIEDYDLTGKLEVDLNFASPIKYTTSEQTNIKVILKNFDGDALGEVNLGKDISTGNIRENLSYSLKALDFQRQPLEEGDIDLNFYHLTFDKLPVGTYSIEVVGNGYKTAKVNNIEIQNSSKRVLIGTTNNSVVIDNKGTEDTSDDVVENYTSSFLMGDLNGDKLVNEADYEELKNAIKNKSNEALYDLNRDGKVDITDLTYIHSNILETQIEAEIKDTDLIIDPNSVKISLDDNFKVSNDVDIKEILKDTNTIVTLESDKNISENNPIQIPIDLSGMLRSGNVIESINIKAPTENAPSSGQILNEAGEVIGTFGEKDIKDSVSRTVDGKAMSDIKIDLGKQVAVSKITIKITGSKSNKNLAEIAKVEFLNNVYKELPKPKMNIPVINNFTSTTQVGQESMTIGWDHEVNVTGYEIKVEKINPDNNKVINTSYYKTSKNTLRIEKVEAYGLYRISIQSLSGDWESGYKDSEENGYVADAEGITNLTNNKNDKDGKPDNVDDNYNPVSWDSTTGKLSGDNANFGKDSIIELQVIPETAPEGPEGITVKGEYKKLIVSWKAHAKAKDYDLYYRKIGTKAWFKANDPDKSYVDTDLTNEIPDNVANLTKEEKLDANELIRGTSYTIEGLEDSTTYEIMMTATNHHGTGGLSQVYMGATTKLIPPKTINYKLINTPNGTNELTNHIVDVELPKGNIWADAYASDEDAIVDNDYTTYWEHMDWDYGDGGPVLTFDNEYEISSLKVIRRLDVKELTQWTKIDYYNEESQTWEEVKSSFYETNNGQVVNIELEKPVKTRKIRIGVTVYASVPWGNYRRATSIAEVKVYQYDSLQNDVDNLFEDDLHLSIKKTVDKNLIDELTTRANTVDEGSGEYHPNQAAILEELKRASDLLNDNLLSDDIITLDSTIHNLDPQNKIGQINNYQALGVAVRPGDKVTIYIGSARKDTKFDLILTQFNAESGTAYKQVQTLSVGKNEVIIPETGFNMNYEKGGNLYIGLKSGFAENNVFKVRVSGGVEIPHLNVNNIIDNTDKEADAKEMIKTYIEELETYVKSLPEKYEDVEDPENNIYKYDPKTSILNATDIEGERVMLSLAADKVLEGIQSGLEGRIDEQVDRLYNNLLAWEQLMKISYAQQGLLESPIDLNDDKKIDADETAYYNKNRAPKNRMNIKYQRMFTGAFMYASAHHVGIGYESIAGTMTGVPFEINENGELVETTKGDLFGWGISHEIGHVHDINGLTYTETTNNILALITQTFDDETESRLEGGGYISIYDKVTSNSVGLASDVFTRLGMFWQLHLAYDSDYTYKMLELNTDNDLSNDTFFAKLYRATRTNGIAEVEMGYDRTAQTFIMRASDAAGKDLREFFAKWGLVSSPKTDKYIEEKGYEKEDKAIYYLNDEARRLRLAAKDNIESLNMEEGTEVKAEFGEDLEGKEIKDRSYLNQKEVPLVLSVNKDDSNILGYEIIRKEATSYGTQEMVVGFVERDKESEVTNYIDEIDAVNNRTFEYKVKAYDYNLNVTKEFTIGTIKVNHDGSIAKSNWIFETNTRSEEDIADEHSGHGQDQHGTIKRINDGNPSTIYTATKTTNNVGGAISGDPYVTIDLGEIKPITGLTYHPGEVQAKKFSFKNFFSKSSETEYSPITNYEVYVSDDGENWTKAHSGTFENKGENKINFNENGTNENSELWTYEAQYVKLVAPKAKTIAIGEINIQGPTGDNIEIGTNNGNNVYENGIGKLKKEYTFADGESIPEGSIIITGQYKGDPAFNVPLVLNENGENLSRFANVLLFAKVPDDAELGAVAEGTWVYYITPEDQLNGDITGTKVKAELYRYNRLGDNDEPIGQRLVSDTFLYEFNKDSLPEIELSNSEARTLSSENTSVIKINGDMIQKVFNNRN